MASTPSVQFFETQFQRQVRQGETALNPFEADVLPFLGGRVLDLGCGLGQLDIALAERGASVLALDASPTAVAHLQAVVRERGLAIDARQADLRHHEIVGSFDAIACIGLLMFFDGATASRQLEAIQAHVRPGGVAAVNVLVEGTTYLDMFDPAAHCLWPADELARRFAGWACLHHRQQDFAAPGGRLKRFVTLVARKPA